MKPTLVASLADPPSPGPRSAETEPSVRVADHGRRRETLRPKAHVDVQMWKNKTGAAWEQVGTAQKSRLGSWKSMAIALSDEEREILEAHPIEELGQLTARAQEDYRGSSEANRDETYRRYLMLLNLGAKVIVYERPEPSPELLAAQARYLSAIRDAEERKHPLSEGEQAKLKESLMAETDRRGASGFKNVRRGGMMMRHGHSTTRTAFMGALVLASLGVVVPQRADAAALFTGEQVLTPHQFIWFTQFVAPGTTVTFSTRNTTPGGDPVMQAFLSNGAPQPTVTPIPWVYVDDSGGSINPAFTISGGPAGTWYVILVRSFSTTTAGRTDLFMNETRLLTQATFGGIRTDTTWTANQQLIASGSQRGTPNDTMLFLIDWPPFGGGPTIGAFAFDDDSGPNLYASMVTTSSSTSDARVILGLFPTSVGSGHLVKQDNPWQWGWDPFLGLTGPFCTSFDSDFDCVNNQLEPLLGTIVNDFDSDNDHLPDGLEAFGNDGWSFSEGSQNPTRGNVYVETDFMVGTGPTQNKTPYGNLAADASTIFTTDSGGIKRIDIVISNSVPFTSALKYGSCSGSCVNFYTLKTANFGRDLVGGVLQPVDSFRNQFFHYTVFGNRIDSATSCISGRGELLGNDVAVTLNQDAPPTGCGWAFSVAEQRGTFMHELGHNLNLDHQGNDRTDGRNGTAHTSVMNYRFQTAGTGRTGVFGHSYSFGTTPCTPCSISPRKACIDLRLAERCNTQAGTSCDCDTVEWSRQNLDFSEQPVAFRDGGPQPGTEDPASTARRGATATGKDLAIRPDSRSIAQESDSARRTRIAARLKKLEAIGRRKGKDYEVSEDGLHVYAQE